MREIFSYIEKKSSALLMQVQDFLTHRDGKRLANTALFAYD
jgi:hypothetical protein